MAKCPVPSSKRLFVRLVTDRTPRRDRGVNPIGAIRPGAHVAHKWPGAVHLNVGRCVRRICTADDELRGKQPEVLLVPILILFLPEK